MKNLLTIIAVTFALSACETANSMLDEVDDIAQRVTPAGLSDRLDAAQKKQQESHERRYGEPVDPFEEARKLFRAEIEACLELPTQERVYRCKGDAFDRAYAKVGVRLYTGVPLSVQFAVLGEAVDLGNMTRTQAEARLWEIERYEVNGVLTANRQRTMDCSRQGDRTRCNSW